MARSRFHSLLRAKVEEEAELRSAAIASGNCTDLPHYRYETGFVQGMLAVLKLADDIESEDG
jgi:hypothetical protein